MNTQKSDYQFDIILYLYYTRYTLFWCRICIYFTLVRPSSFFFTFNNIHYSFWLLQISIYFNEPTIAVTYKHTSLPFKIFENVWDITVNRFWYYHTNDEKMCETKLLKQSSKKWEIILKLKLSYMSVCYKTPHFN